LPQIIIALETLKYGAWSSAMGSFKRSRVFDPLDLEIMKARVEAQEPLRDLERDAERQEGLRDVIFAFAGTGHVDYDNICESVLVRFHGLEVTSSRTMVVFSTSRSCKSRRLRAPNLNLHLDFQEKPDYPPDHIRRETGAFARI
jgi:hypothetical protein